MQLSEETICRKASIMKQLESLAKALNALLMAFVAFASVIFLICGIYILNDIYYTNRTAFVSYDLLKYRPSPKSGTGEKQTFSELKRINSDTVGWLELFGTHINYPVVQGNDNLEYLNKDIFGYSTMSGSIYLASENDRSFGDRYNIIYGHHMNNGAMFGDIEKYLDPDFFASHSEGILQTAQGDYSVRVLACIKTNAYENIVYQINTENSYPALYDYIKEHSVNSTELPENLENSQLLGMSTCTDAVTDGRIVLFALIQPWNEPVDGNAEERMAQAEDFSENNSFFSLKAYGHKLQGEKWSLLNLLCVICTFLTFLPLWALKTKFRQFSYSKRKIRELEELPDKNTEIVKNLKHFIRKGRMGLVAELLIFLVSAVFFLFTENLKGRMSILDKWTGIMILTASASLLTDFVCLRYRGERPEK